MQFRCHKDIAFGIIFLRSPVDPSPFSHAGHAVQLVKKSKLESKILFATFASEGTSTFKYSFDGGVPSFQETSSPQASQMFDVALGRPVRLGLLLEELQTISEGAVNRNLEVSCHDFDSQRRPRDLGQNGVSGKTDAQLMLGNGYNGYFF